jgi:hypothetical protein
LGNAPSLGNRRALACEYPRSTCPELLSAPLRQAHKLQQVITALEKERSAILAYFFENPTDYAPEKATRLQELNEEIARSEEQWLRLSTE